MADIKLTRLVEGLEYEFKKVLESTMLEILPDVKFDRDSIFRAFCKAVDKNTNTWTSVDDRYVSVKLNVKCPDCDERFTTNS